jgi:hypothetical protein
MYQYSLLYLSSIYFYSLFFFTFVITGAMTKMLAWHGMWLLLTGCLGLSCSPEVVAAAGSRQLLLDRAQLLGVLQPSKDMQMPSLACSPTHGRVPGTWRVLRSEPLQHLQVSSGGSTLTRPLIVQARRVVLCSEPLQHVHVPP